MKTIISNRDTKVTIDLSFKHYNFKKENITIYSKLPISSLKDLENYWNSYIKLKKIKSKIIVNIDHIGSGRFFYAYINNFWYITDDWRRILKKINRRQWYNRAV